MLKLEIGQPGFTKIAPFTWHKNVTYWTEIYLEMAAPHDTNMSHEIHITGERATAPLLHSQVRSLLVLEGATGEVGRATDGERIYCATRVADDDDGADKNYLIFLQVRQ